MLLPLRWMLYQTVAVTPPVVVTPPTPTGGWLWDWSAPARLTRKKWEEQEAFERREQAERLAAHLVQQRMLDARRKEEQRQAKELSDMEAVEMMLADLLSRADEYRELSEAYWMAELARLERLRLRLEDEAALMTLLMLM